MHKKNIVVIEDDAFHSKVICTILTSLHCSNVITVKNGIEALSVIVEKQPDIIFCDLMMPEMDGVELVKHIAKTCSDAFLIFVSSSAIDVQSAVKEMAHVYGFTHVECLKKPISRKDVRSLLTARFNDKTVTPLEVPYTTPTFSKEEIAKAFREGEFKPYFQAHFNSSNGHLKGAEALVRWHHPTMGVLTPFQFLDSINDAGFSYQLTCTMLRKSLEETQAWSQKSVCCLGISINVSVKNMEQDGFAERVLGILREYRFPAHRLTLEITESDLPTDIAKLLENTTRLRMRNVSISIDDFGTGHSSIKQLLVSPFTEIKIDRTFVDRMLKDQRYLAAVKCIISLAKNLKLSIVAEGVETLPQAQHLAKLGCDTLQGYYFAKPMASDAFFQFATNYCVQKKATC